MAENAAERLMIRYLPELIRSISGPSELACELLARRVISRSLYKETIDLKTARSAQDRIASICDAALSSIHVTPAHLVEFVEAARQDSSAVATLCEEMSKHPAYVEQEKLVLMKRERGSKNSPLSGGSQLSSTQPDSSADILPDGPLKSSHLVHIYESIRDLREWKELGLYLGVPYGTLESIEEDRKTLFDRKIAMLDYWVCNCTATKESLAVALNKMGKKLQRNAN